MGDWRLWLLGWGLGLVGLAYLTGAWPLALAGAGPLMLFLLGGLFGPPARPEVVRRLTRTTLWTGDAVEVVWEVRLGWGPCLCTLMDPLPPSFALEKGSNLRLVAKGFLPLRTAFTYTVRCPRRGEYTLPPTRWHLESPLGLLPAREGEAGGPLTLQVLPRLGAVRRVRPLRTRAVQPFPESDLARLGAATTDFRELRRYLPGDPYRLINWKATARQGGDVSTPPMVNEYEREGRKAVWLFLDAGPAMAVGTSLESALDRAAEAMATLAHYFLRRGYRVGASFFHTRDPLLYPDAGLRQFWSLARRLLHLRPHPDGGITLAQAVSACRPFLALHRPLAVVLTRLDDPATVEEVAQGLQALAGLGTHRRPLPRVVVGLVGFALVPGDAPYRREAEVLQAGRVARAVRRLRRTGALVVAWNPRREPLSQALARGILVQ